MTSWTSWNKESIWNSSEDLAKQSTRWEEAQRTGEHSCQLYIWQRINTQTIWKSKQSKNKQTKNPKSQNYRLKKKKKGLGPNLRVLKRRKKLAKKYLKNCSSLENTNQNSLRFHLTPILMAKINRTARNGVGTGELSFSTGETANW